LLSVAAKMPTLLITPQLPIKRVLVLYRIFGVSNRLFKIGVYSNLRQHFYILYFILNWWFNSSLNKSNFLYFIDAAIFILKGLWIYLLSLGFYKVYKLVEIFVTLYTISELFCVGVLYNIQILNLIL
jgi:hypothetical protein